MKLTKKQISKKKVALLVVALLVVLSASSIIFYQIHKNNTPPFKDKDTSQERDNPLDQTGFKQNLAVVNEESNKQQDTPKIDPSFTVKLTDFQQSNGQILIRTVVDSPTDGACRYTLSTTEAKPVIRQNNAVGSDGPKYCNITIPEAEFEKIGVWKLTVEFTTQDKTNSVSQDVTIN